jgi:hypothetical protein
LKNNGIEISKEIRHKCFLVADREIDVVNFMDRIRKEYDKIMEE